MKLKLLQYPIDFLDYCPNGRVKTYINDYLGDSEYADELINFIPLRALLKEIEEIVNENIKAKTQYHIWQLGEALIPHLKGLSYSKNLSEEERNELNSLTAKTNELAERGTRTCYICLKKLKEEKLIIF